MNLLPVTCSTSRDALRGLLLGFGNGVATTNNDDSNLDFTHARVPPLRNLLSG
jgi:hypothetical protein